MQKLYTLLAVATVGAFNTAHAREQIEIVGSSTVYPFALAVAEEHEAMNHGPMPNIVSTGSGGGFKLFCAGVGEEHPDITNAPRRMKPSEFETCQGNGVTEITEIEFGYDGIVLVNSLEGEPLSISRAQLATALAAQGPMPTKWSDVDASLPDAAIKVFGPPEGAGTRDALIELVLEKGCEEAGIPCDDISIRTDSAWVDIDESAEGRAQLLEMLPNEPSAYGILGYSYLDQNSDTLRGATIEGIAPEFDSVATNTYPLSRSLYFYVKNAHTDVVGGLVEYASEFMVGAYDGPDGYLIETGVVPITETRYFEMVDNAQQLTPITSETLKNK